MKAFWIYTGLRLLLFVAVYAVFAGLWVLVSSTTGVLLIPFVAALIVSSFLSLRLLAPQRDRFVASVQERASRASSRFEEMKAKEDTPER